MLTLIFGAIIVIIIFILTMLFVIFMFKSIFSPGKCAPYVGSFKKDLKIAKRLNIVKGARILDLGCGDAKALRFFHKNFDIDRAVGYDVNPYAIMIGIMLNYVMGYKNIKIYRKNFLTVNIAGYDYIYIYLLPKQLALMENWVWVNKNKNTIVISNSFQFKEHKPFQVIKNHKGKDTIFLYK